MIKTVSLCFGNTTVDFLFYRSNTKQRTDSYTKFHKHLNTELHFAIKGAYEYEFTNRKISLTQGNMLVIPPGILHKPVSDSNGDYEFKTLTLKISAPKSDGFGNFFKSIFGAQEIRSIKVSDKLLCEIVNLCNAISPESYMQSIYLNSLASSVMYTLCTALNPDNKDFTPVTGHHIEAEIENMVNNSNMSLSDIADSINYSTRQTERIIKQLYGKSLTKIREEFEEER